MTAFQLISILTAGPMGFLMLLHGIRAAVGKGNFTVAQAILLFVCVAVLLAAFVGVK